MYDEKMQYGFLFDWTHAMEVLRGCDARQS